ncbi:MAG: Lhr family ATP-dependent helicase, partial [Acidimicrobiia bacterium]
MTGPIESPDHPLVRQTMHDTLTEALDIDGLEALLAGLESGRVRAHCRDTTEASVFAHEILSARPYAFLDDAEAVDRRTNAVPLRRGLPVDLSSIGRLDPGAVQRVREEVAPDPGSADELHDLLLGLVVTPATEQWRPLFTELAARGRVGSESGSGRVGSGSGAGTDTEHWWATEQSTPVAALLEGRDDEAHPRERTAAAVLRGHLDISGPLTAAALAERCGLTRSTVDIGLAVLERDGFALRGAFTDPEAPVTPDTVEWCARRLLARMHAYSRKTRRQSVEPVSAQDFMRFLLRWQHVAPDTQLRGRVGIRLVIEQLQGYEAGAATWEPEILRRRLVDYQPVLLDRLCLDGEVTWLRLSAWQPVSAGNPEGSSRRAAPSKATPITLAFREDLGWLLQLARLATTPEVPGVGATAEVVEALAAKGARFVSELAADTGRLRTDIEVALWDGVARGLLTADGFAAIRSLVED